MKKKEIKMQTKEIRNFKMNDEVYSLRRKVIDMIYEVKNHMRDLPRVEVRIGEARCENVLGLASRGRRQLWITKKAIDMSEDALRNIVYHELVHAVFGFRHDDKCPLMQPTLKTILNKEDCLKHLLKYKNYKGE
tara:strand:+ start:243 stop:644 length:402 start_codon:yes stop_codon:yes gene_type:complete